MAIFTPLRFISSKVEIVTFLGAPAYAAGLVLSAISPEFNNSGVRLHSRDEGAHGPAAVRPEGGGDIAQRRQGEGAAGRRRVGAPQPGRAHALPAQGEEIDVEGARAPAQ